MSGQTVVVARGELSQEGPALAVRVALALPLAGVRSQLVLTGAASLLGLAAAPGRWPWAGDVARELEALLADEEGSVTVELESLRELGLEASPLREGVEVATRDELAQALGAAEHCLVF